MRTKLAPKNHHSHQKSAQKQRARVMKDKYETETIEYVGTLTRT